MNRRVEVLQEFVEASHLGRRREHFEGFRFFRAETSRDDESDWRLSVHAFVASLVAGHKLKKKYKVKL